VMLNATDFNYFAGFIETNFFTELEYVLDLPFYAFPVDTESQSSILAKYGYILPTSKSFNRVSHAFFQTLASRLLLNTQGRNHDRTGRAAAPAPDPGRVRELRSPSFDQCRPQGSASTGKMLSDVCFSVPLREETAGSARHL